jgi:hypothetical protein
MMHSVHDGFGKRLFHEHINEQGLMMPHSEISSA